MNLHLPFRRLTSLVAAAALAAAVLALAACGVGGGGGDAQKVIDQTFGVNSDLKSGKVSFDAKFNGKVSMKAGGKTLGGGKVSMDDIPISADVKASGAFSNLGKDKVPKFDLDMMVAFKTEAGGSIPAVNQSVPMGFVFTGDRAIVRFQGTNYALSDAEVKEALASAKRQGQSRSSLGALGLDPGDWITNVGEEGTESVGGVETTHVSGDVDVDKLFDDLGELAAKAGQAGTSELTSEQKKQLKDAVKQAKIDIYTGKEDRILRRVTVSLRFDGETEQSQGSASVAVRFEGEASFDLELRDVNERQKITAPKGATRPLSGLQGGLGSSFLQGAGGGVGSPSFGGGTGGGSSGGGSGGGTSGSSSRGAKSYLACVEKAKDAAAVAQCESLLK